MKIKHEGIHVRNNCNVRIPKMHLHMIGAFKSCKDLNAPHRLHIW